MELIKDLKILLIGNLRTGKTQFMNKWTKNVFSEKYNSTIVSEFGFKIFEKDGKLYRIQMWDITGNDHDHSVTKIFAKNSYGFIIMSDVINKQTREE